MGDRVGGSITGIPLLLWNRQDPQGLHLLRVKISCLAFSKHPSSHTKLTVNCTCCSPSPAYPGHVHTQGIQTRHTHTHSHTHRAYKPHTHTQQTNHIHMAYKPHTHMTYKPHTQTAYKPHTHTPRAYKPHTHTRHTNHIYTHSIQTTYTHDRTFEGRRTEAPVLSSHPGFTMF